MDLGTRRRLRREQLRREHGAEVVVWEEAYGAWLLSLVIISSCVAGGVAHLPIATALDQLYCTSQSCAWLPQALTGWALAVAPLLVYLWRPVAAVYLSLPVLCFVSTFFITSNKDVPVDAKLVGALWTLPLTYYLVGLVFVPVSLGIAWFVRPEQRPVVVAVQHWFLLAGLILWLA